MTERNEWKVGSALMITNDGNWYNGRVKQIEGKGKKEYLTITYNNGQSIKLKRDSKDLKVDYFPEIEEEQYNEPEVSKNNKKKAKLKKAASKLKKSHSNSSKDVQIQKVKDAKLAKKVALALGSELKEEEEEEEEDVLD